ncbi:uncharacterized protein TRAVEDRAFT_52064 [Trametes versicolor FP-101664 SS1]|uniref:uncharacterized protein n=1 Tax=Trametes versicolor (strain FP-101664) TaxID=717944 RepID=UPI00046237AC|nr:uncharacterized protein TRAVEDRAFT_52064 [Trametes versicolor FP-101664 SS1]EIW54356.1 hypothetical protein TRAVEDRAFT_52064 [Trametes versicolor FP-101664 SS1]
MANAEALDRRPADTTSSISPRAEKQRPIHRSVRALERNADVFVWWPDNTLVACFNAQITPVTPDILLRWIGMPAESIQEGQIVVKHARLEHRGILDYSMHPLETVGNTTVLSAGVYGCFISDPTEIPKGLAPIEPGIYVRSFKEIRSDHEGHVKANPLLYEPDHLEWYNSDVYDIADALRQQVDVPHNQCVFTGYTSNVAASNAPTPSIITGSSGPTSDAAAKSMGDNASVAPKTVELYWIFPSSMNGENDTRSIDLRKCECWENILPMCVDVHELWFANELSVDVDDGYRIRIFTRAAAAVMAGLPERLDNPNPEWAFYFRLHLLHTLLLRFCGGDICTEYGYRTMADLSARIAEANAVSNREAAIWQTEMGKDALELLDAGIQRDLATSDDEDEASDSEEEEE